MIIDEKIAKWIWIKNTNFNSVDFYADFKDKFEINDFGNGKTTLLVSCDSSFCCYLNDNLVGFSDCSDYPEYKLYDQYDITEFCKQRNDLFFTVWYIGNDQSQTYIKDDAGLWFMVVHNGKIVIASGEDTLSRLNINYKNGYEKWITPQLGFSFYYDNTIEGISFEKSVIAPFRKVLPRPQKNLYLGERVEAIYNYKKGSVLIDLSKETAGFADLHFYSSIEQELKIGYGEFLLDGNVQHNIGGRDFTFEVKAKKGENKLFFPLRRIAGRYLEVFYTQEITPVYIGVKPVFYPVTVKDVKFDNPLIQKIYDVSVDTLRLCMHEHYEDCPWREQALYNLDSRHQMLFGYYAFKETEYQRSNLVLMSKGLRSDGFLSICFPTGRERDIPIPSFSLAYILQVCEYIQYTKDKSILDEIGTALDRLVASFENKIDENGLIPVFPYPYWNFYEWTDGNERINEIGRSKDEPYILDYDLVLNAFYVFVMEKYNELCGKRVKTNIVKSAIAKTFYVKEKGLFKNSINDNRFSQIGNTYALLIGLGDSNLLEKVANSECMTPASLSIKFFVYQALLIEKDRYKQVVLDDIVKRYSYMLSQGATSFWETDNGWRDFGGAGSLCHGWSALPVYYFNVLLKGEK